MRKYLEKKQVQKKPESKSTFLAGPALPSPAFASPSSSRVYSPDAIEHIKVGCFYQIDQSKLHERTAPEQLRAVRVIMVSAKGAFKVAVRFPSLHSLHTYITENGNPKPDAKQIPALDEKYVMSPDMASEVLYRRIPPQEMVDQSNIWSFWTVRPPLKNHPRSSASSPVVRSGGGAMNSTVVSKKGPCWSELTFAGMVKWGKRRQIRYLRRHESSPSSYSDDEETEKGKEVIELEEDEEEEEGEETEEEASPPVLPWKMNLRSRKRKRPDNKKKIKAPTQKRSKSRAKCPKQNNQIVAVPDRSSRKLAKVKLNVARWSAGRYKLAEENMLKVMKEKGAVVGNPIRRPALRAEARRLIGDTGLLDHLLKHMAGKVAPGGAERFRRRHNADGAMEYWLESADLVHIRKEAGVQDPYWTPPPGWKPGDSPTQDPTCAREIKELRKEIDKIRREMEESKQQGNAGLDVVTGSNSCLTGVDLDRDGSLIQIKEACAELEKKIAKMDEETMEFVTKKEEQMAEFTQSLSGIKEKIRVFESSKEDAVTISEGAPPPSETESAGEKKEEAKLNSGDMAAAAAEDKAAKIERLRSGFRICKPQGTFLWPDMGSPANSPSPSASSQIVAPPHDPFVVPTPPSSSSSDHRHLISPTTPPVKPVAERGPVTTTTLCNVTTIPSAPPIFAPPPVLAPQQTQSSTTITISKTLLINLNELPVAAAPNPNPNPQTGSEAARTVTTYHRRHHHHLPRMVKEEEEEEEDGNARIGDDQQQWCASRASTWKGEKCWMAVGTASTSLEG